MDELTRLLSAARHGDEIAMREFVAATQRDVWRFCAALVGDEEASDATQETFIRAWRSAPTFRAESSAMTWLLAIARRACFEASRRRRRRPTPAVIEDRAVAADRIHEIDIEDLLGRLDPDRRTALVLTQILGLSYDEAAQVCGCPVGTIRSRVARGRADLLAAAGGDAGVASGSGSAQQ